MKTKPIRIAEDSFVNESTLNDYVAFDLLFGGFDELVYIPDYSPFYFTNGTWTGVLGHLMNDNRMD